MQLAARFHLDFPEEKKLNRVTLFQGWYLPERDEEPRALFLAVNSRPICSLLPEWRPDVAAALPQFPRALRAGFSGELVLPEEIQPGTAVEVALCAERRDGKISWLTRDIYHYDGENALKQEAGRKNYSVEELLWKKQFRFHKIEHAYHSFPAGLLPAFRLLSGREANAYNPLALEIMEDARGPVLDFGAGKTAREFLRENVLYLDRTHYPHTDVVSGHASLPLKPDSFDAIVSLAVLEHVPDPFAAAREFMRVLKPGGRILIDTAFMQPLHADPGHYFNMPESGLKEVMRGFEIEQIGSQPHQQPSFSLRMQMEHALPMLPAGKWKNRFLALLEELRKEGKELDESLGVIGRQMLAAGVFVLARKPHRGFAGWTR